MTIGSLETGILILLSFLVYIIPVIFVIYWMIKMMKNSNENLKINREILERLRKQKND